MSDRKSLTTYVALLRGINVGGNALVSMKELKNCFEKLGLQAVSTYINSGNVIFKDGRKDVAALGRLIESGIKSRLKMDVRVVLKTKQEIAAICNKIPRDWVTDKFMRTDVMFLWKEADKPDLISTIAINPKVDNLLRAKGAVIWKVDRKNYAKSKLPRIIGTSLYKNMTARNANTTRKLLDLMSGDD